MHTLPHIGITQGWHRLGLGRSTEASHVQALKPELSACKRAADRGFKALIHHIFTEHPSRVPGAKADIPDCSPDNWKSALQTALR